MAHLPCRGWHWRIRIQRSFWLYRRGPRRGKVAHLSGARGHACFWPQVCVTEQRDGPVPLAVARPQSGNACWYGRSDEPTAVRTLEAYGLRFDIAENVLDDTSNGCQWESSLMRSAPALRRLCLGLAMTTLYLVSQGVAVVQQGKRRGVDPHWCRGQSAWKIGWTWGQWALS